MSARGMVAAVLLVLGSASWAMAEDRTVKDLNLDLAVPESPAFTVLGLTPQAVVRPTSPREFTTSLLNGVDSNGNFQTGLALDAAPYLVLGGSELSVGQYRSSPVIRLLSRTQVSVATAKGVTEDDKGLRLALGVRLTPWDEGDPRLDRQLDRCFDAAVKWGDAPTLEERRKLSEAREAKVRADFERCRQEGQRRNWNRSSWTLGGAPSWISEDGKLDKVRSDGGALWTSVAYGFEGVPVLQDTSQVIVHLRYRAGERVPDAESKGRFLTQDSTVVGARLRLGGEQLGLALEGAWVHAEPSRRAGDDSLRISAGIDFRVAKDVWFEFAIGGETRRREGGDEAFVLGSLKWGLARQPGAPPPAP